MSNCTGSHPSRQADGRRKSADMSRSKGDYAYVIRLAPTEAKGMCLASATAGDGGIRRSSSILSRRAAVAAPKYTPKMRPLAEYLPLLIIYNKAFVLLLFRAQQPVPKSKAAKPRLAVQHRHAPPVSSPLPQQAGAQQRSACGTGRAPAAQSADGAECAGSEPGAGAARRRSSVCGRYEQARESGRWGGRRGRGGLLGRPAAWSPAPGTCKSNRRRVPVWIIAACCTMAQPAMLPRTQRP
jgi:hypothetical protein